MIGGLKQTTSRLTIAAAAGLFMGGIALTPAQAADLGGDCCADLEERVAELEATTVRKGNRKVSVKLTGQVIRQMLFWDDGQEDDVYFTDGGFTHSRFSLEGTATISPGRKAGFILQHDYIVSNDPSQVTNCTSAVGTQCMADANENSVNGERFADLWVSDDKLGKVSLGQGNMASNGTAEVDLSGTGFLGGSDMEANVSNMKLRTTAAGYGRSLGTVINNLDGLSRKDRIRYDTPSLGGFILSTSVAADDQVDFAIRFAKEWNSVRCAAAFGAAHDTAEKNVVDANGNRADNDLWIYSTSGSCLHTPSGLNLTVAYGETDEGGFTKTSAGATLINPGDREYFYIKGGISRRWNSHGKTSISVAYGNYENMDNIRNTNTSDEIDAIEVAIVQAIDSAAMELFAAYYNYDFDDNTATNYEEFDAVIAGARIKF